MAWDFSLGSVTGQIADVLKSRDQARATEETARAQIAASSEAARNAQSLTFAGMSQVQFAIVAVVVSIVGVALLRSRKG